jgi:hypothetical protein
VRRQTIDSRIRQPHVARYGATDEVEGYLLTLENLIPVADDRRGENHHMLMKSVWPEFADLKTNPWNRLRVTRAIHTALTELQSRFEARLRFAMLLMKGQSVEAQLEARRRGGKIGGKRAFKLHPNQASEMGKLGGKIGGKKTAESGHLARIASRGGTIGGKIGGRTTVRRNVDGPRAARPKGYISSSIPRSKRKQGVANMIKALFLCALCWATTVSAFGQEALKLGPFGKPILVMDESGNWSIPINLYSDSDVDVFIPDITTAGWISWHATQFRQTGIFLVSVFSFYKNDHLCRKNRIPVGHETDPKLLEACAALRYQRKLVSIDTRGGTITVLEAIVMGRDALLDPQNLTKMHSTFPLAKAAPKEAYDRMLAIVDREINDYKGLTIEEAIANNSKVALNMMHQAYTPASDSGCPGRTPQQMANWHNTGCPPLNQTCGYNAQGWFLCSTPTPAEVVRPAQAVRDQSTSGNGPRGYSGTPTYKSWKHMIGRCTNPNNAEYFRYGGAGVTVASEWRTFEEFIKSMGERPEGCTLGRILDMGNYENGNAFFMTDAEQKLAQKNKRALLKFAAQAA